MEKRIPIGILKVMLVDVIISGLLLFLAAFLSYKLHFDDKKIQIAVYCIYGITNFLGGILIGKVMEKRKFFWGMVEGGLYVALLVLVSLIAGAGAEFSVQLLYACIISVVCGMVGGSSSAIK